MKLRISIFLTIIACLSINAVYGQDFEALTRAYSEEECSSCAGWNKPYKGFLIHHKSYYVGTSGLSAILITSSEGHVLIDAGLPDSAPLIIENIRSLGFDPADIKLILNSHVHYDHAGGIAAMQHVSGARVAASPKSAPVLETGKGGPDDPQYGILLDMPIVENVERFLFGDTLHVGPIAVKSHATAGHTPGGTSWSWESCDGEECINIVYGDSQTPVSADGFRYSDSKTYPAAVEDFKRGHNALEQIECDVLITTHPGAVSLWSKYTGDPQSLLDPMACKKYAAFARKQLESRLAREAIESSDQD